MHQRQRQRGIGAGQQGQVGVAFVGGFGAAGVDAHQPCAVALGLLGMPPEVQVAADGIAAPDDDELAVRKLLHPRAQLAAQRLHQGLGPGAGADGAIQQAGPQAVEEAGGNALALHLAHRARIAVGQDGAGVVRGNGLQPGGDVGQRLVPAHGHELARAALAFGADALHGLQQPLGVVGALGIARHLGAQHTAGGGVVGVALHLDGHAVLHGGDEGAGIGAIVRAGTTDVRHTSHLIGTNRNGIRENL